MKRPKNLRLNDHGVIDMYYNNRYHPIGYHVTEHGIKLCPSMVGDYLYKQGNKYGSITIELRHESNPQK